MKHSLTVLIITTVCYCAFSETLKCGNNEEIDYCPQNCSYNYCPKNETHDRIPCPKPNRCPPPACKCSFNHRRAENGTCIPSDSCPPFECTRPNEQYVACPALCPSDSCSDASFQGLCPFTLIVIECTPKCQCKPGYWRKDGICVPYTECLNAIGQDVRR